VLKATPNLHGGTVEVNSAGVGQGEFIVRLPMLAETVALTPPAVAGDPALGATGIRILIVDDNHDAADMLATLLGLDGHETHKPHDGVEAVEATRKNDHTAATCRSSPFGSARNAGPVA
jgi:hypothetical protein